MSKDKYKANYDMEDLDAENIQDVDVKINPSFYMHHTLLKFQAALIGDDIGAMVIKSRFLADHLFQICAASNMITEEDIKLELDKYKDSDEFKEATDDNLQIYLLANKKLGIITKKIFQSRGKNGKLKM